MLLATQLRDALTRLTATDSTLGLDHAALVVLAEVDGGADVGARRWRCRRRGALLTTQPRDALTRLAATDSTLSLDHAVLVVLTEVDGGAGCVGARLGRGSGSGRRCSRRACRLPMLVLGAERTDSVLRLLPAHGRLRDHDLPLVLAKLLQRVNRGRRPRLLDLLLLHIALVLRSQLAARLDLPPRLASTNCRLGSDNLLLVLPIAVQVGLLRPCAIVAGHRLLVPLGPQSRDSTTRRPLPGHALDLDHRRLVLAVVRHVRQLRALHCSWRRSRLLHTIQKPGARRAAPLHGLDLGRTFVLPPQLKPRCSSTLNFLNFGGMRVLLAEVKPRGAAALKSLDLRRRLLLPLLPLLLGELALRAQVADAPLRLLTPHGGLTHHDA